MENKPNKIIVHHSGDSSPRDQFARINEWHKTRGFPQSVNGYFVGYHYLINKLGILTKTKVESEEGAHCVGQNFQSIGICLEGNFDEELPTEAQEVTLGNLLVEICHRRNFTALNIHPHREFSPTSCYGRILENDWAAKIYIQNEISRIRKLISTFLLWIKK